MHVVKVRHAQQPRQPHPSQTHFLVRMNRVVAGGQSTAKNSREHQRIEHRFGHRRTDTDFTDKRWPEASKDSQIGQRDIPANRIGHEIDVMPQLAEGLDPVVLAERGAAGLEKWLRREHQDAKRTLYDLNPWRLYLTD